MNDAEVIRDFLEMKLDQAGFLTSLGKFEVGTVYRMTDQEPITVMIGERVYVVMIGEYKGVANEQS